MRLFNAFRPEPLIMTRWTLLLSASLLALTLSAHDHGPAMKTVGAGPQDRIRYILNKGQWDPQVLYKAEVTGLAVFLEREGLMWSKLQDDAGERMHDAIHMTEAEQQAFLLKGHAWRMRFVGGNVNAEVVAADRTTAYHNYFLGNDPTKWAGHVPLFGEVTYRELWPGVDLRLYSKDLNYKYDLLLRSGADASQVGFAYEGLESLSLDAEGDLVMRTSVGELTEMHPVAWYADGDKASVECDFTLKEGKAGFVFAAGTDLSRPIVIDPLLMASTLSGTGNIGTTQNYGHSATYDDNGNIYTGARCFGQGYPVTPGAFDLTFGGNVDISISKLNPDGSNLIYATYLGGNSQDYPHSLVVNANEELYMYGTTQSTNYPTSAGCFDNTFGGGTGFDIALTHLNASGSALIGSTYLGGAANDGNNSFTNNYGDQFRGEIIVDPAGNAYLATCTDGVGFPTTAGSYQPAYSAGQDGVAVCMSPDMTTMIWGTHIGGTNEDMAFGIKLDGAGGVFVGGSTSTAAFPTTPGAYQTTFQGGGADAFIIHLTNNGSTLAGSTFVGTTGNEHAFFLQVDIDGDVYIYGQSDAGTFTIQPAGTYGQAGTDIFIAKFDAALTAPIFTSTVGAAGGFSSSCVPVAFLVDVCKHIYISGYSTYSGGFATTPGALYTTGGFYLASYDVDMAGLLYATYYDGAGHVDGGTSRFDSNGIVYQAVCTSGPFPTTANAYSTVQPLSWDIGVFKIDFQVAGVNAAGAGTLNQGCAPIQIDFLNTSTGDQWIWDFGDGSPLDTTYAPSHTYTTPGAFTVTLIAFDSLSCNLADTITFPVTIGQSQPLTAAFSAVQNTDCTISQVITTNQSTGSPLAFTWDMGDGTFLTDTNVVHNYAGPGVYDIELLVYDPTGCSQPDSLTIPFTVLPPLAVEALFTVTQVPDCDDLIVTTANASTGPGPISYSWNMGNGTFLSGQDVTYTYSGAGTYTITLVASDANTCNQSDTLATQLVVSATQPVSAGFTVEQVFDCAQMVATTTNTSTGSFLGFTWDMGDGSALLPDTNVTHSYTSPGSYTVTLLVTDLLGCSPSDTATATLVVDPLIPVVADFSLLQVNDCTLLEVEGTNLSTGDSVSYSWNMGDGTVLTSTDVTHSYSTPGIYNVTLTVTDLGCGQNDAISQQVNVINTIPVAIAGDAVICPGLVATLDGTYSQGGATYLWSTGQPMPLIQVWTPGEYVLTVTTANCTGTDTVDVVEAPELELSSRFAACPYEELVLTVPIEGQSYDWNTGGTGREEFVVGNGVYVFTVVSMLGCTYTDTITVDPLDNDAYLFAPNAFTPDGDGLNDVFSIGGYGEKEVDLTIFNRWGQQIYQTTSLLRPWDGTFNGEPVKQDVYVYVLKYNAECQQSEYTTAKGHVSVLR
jgi:gliding motility-associated-like protein